MSDTKSSKPADIRFQMFAVVNKTTGTKARVFYSLDNRCDGRKCITLYDRDYGRDLQKVFADVQVQYTNDTDSMTDYFDKGHVDIFESDPIYAEARKQVDDVVAKLAVRREEKAAKRLARAAARRAALYGQTPAVLS